MQDREHNILFTRPVDKDLIEKAKEQGVNITVVPFVNTVSASADVIKTLLQHILGYDAYIFTSTSAVMAVANVDDLLKGNVYCMAGATSQAVSEQLGNCVVVATADNAVSLANKIIADGKVKKLAFFCGDMHLPHLPQILKEHGVEVKELEVYSTIATPAKIDRLYDGIAFFSPSAVKSYLSLNNFDCRQVLFAIGNTTAASLSGYENVIVAEKPTQEAVVNSIIDYYKTGTKLA